MTDSIKSWIEERREFVQGSKLRRWGDKDIRRLTNAIEAVLELHKPIFYYEHEDSCINTDEDHRAERHVEFDLGEYYCEDLPTGEKTCESCYDDEGERVEWPCATVQAIESALKAAETGETMEESRT